MPRASASARGREPTGCEGLDVALLAGGVPVVRDALAVLLCTLEAEHLAGDHTVAIGQVREIRYGGDERPLVFYGGDFGTVSMPARWA